MVQHLQRSKVKARHCAHPVVPNSLEYIYLQSDKNTGTIEDTVETKNLKARPCAHRTVRILVLILRTV